MKLHPPTVTLRRHPLTSVERLAEIVQSLRYCEQDVTAEEVTRLYRYETADDPDPEELREALR